MAIEIENVGMQFRSENGRVTTALAEMSLTIKDGEFVTIVGPSGCGKTTLLNLVAGFERPSSGQLTLDGRVIEGPGADRAVVFQQAALYPWLSVRKNVGLGLRFRYGRRADMSRVDGALEAVGLSDFGDHASYELSGGMAQRVAIARALVTEPRVLLMDEPFGALDAQLRAQLGVFVSGLWESLKCTVLFVTHDIDEAVLLGSRVIVMAASPGRVIADVQVDLPHPRTRGLTVSEPFVDVRRQVLSLMDPDAALSEESAVGGRHV